MSTGEARAGRMDPESEGKSLPGALTRRTGFLLSVMGTFSRGELARAFGPMGIKPRGYGILVALDERGPAAQRDVGERVGIDKSTMVVVVDELEELGLVERRRNPKNRRAYELTLTDAGRSTLSEAEAVVAEVEEAVLAPLDDAQRLQLHELLLRLLPGRRGNRG